MTGINDLMLRDEITDEIPSELPEQGGGQGVPTLLPGISTFLVPSTIAQAIEAFDEELKDEQGNVKYVPDPTNPGQMKPAVVQRIRVKFDRDCPLVVIGGQYDGQSVTTTISNIPRNRARKNEPKILVADMTYFIRESLQMKDVPLTRPKEWVVALMAAAGKQFRAEHGLSAFCNPNKVRYINDANDPTGQSSIEDPSGTKGCGKRLYTSAFKLAQPVVDTDGHKVAFSNIVYCPNMRVYQEGQSPAPCHAKLRGFFQIERWLPPA